MATDARVRPPFQRGRWLPIGVMALLIVVLGGYTNNAEPSFLTTFNLNGVMVATMPLAVCGDGPDERGDGEGVRRVGRRGSPSPWSSRRSCSARTTAGPSCCSECCS